MEASEDIRPKVPRLSPFSSRDSLDTYSFKKVCIQFLENYIDIRSFFELNIHIS